MEQQIELRPAHPENGYFVPALAGARSARLIWAVGWRWCLASMASVAVFALSIWAMISIFAGRGFDTDSLDYWVVVLSVLGTGGATAGAIQWLALRRFLPLSALWWPLASGGGVAAGMRIVTWVVNDLNSFRFHTLFGGLLRELTRQAVPFALLGLIIGLAQWLVLRRRLRYAWLWAITMALAVGASGALAEELDEAWRLPAAFAAYTIICTLGMALLVRLQRDWTHAVD
ncbi:MAG TPA: hypothetical protein VGE07_06390 [Herpetosiphonaceae bacterium]